MIIDKELLLSEDQGDIATAGSAGEVDGSAKVVDKVKDGGPLSSAMLFVKTGAVDFVGGTGVTVALQTADDDGSGSPDTWESVYTQTVLKADMTKNKFIVKTPVPRGLKQYMRILYTSGTAVTTAGELTCGIVPEIREV